MALKPANEWGTSWQTGMGSAGPAFEAGVNRVQTSPGQLAAANKSGYLAGVQNSVDLWASRLQAMTVADWKSVTISKGASRLASGAAAALPKYNAAASKLYAFYQSSIPNLPPRGTFDQNLQRFDQLVRQLHAQRGTFRAAVA